jgi:hypothetical protein
MITKTAVGGVLTRTRETRKLAVKATGKFANRHLHVAAGVSPAQS